VSGKFDRSIRFVPIDVKCLREGTFYIETFPRAEADALEMQDIPIFVYSDEVVIDSIRRVD
jgi:hypothetical protein